MSRIPLGVLSRIWFPGAARPAQTGPARTGPTRPGPTRRGVLRGVLGGGLVTLPLPWLELFVPRSAFAASASLSFGESGFG